MNPSLLGAQIQDHVFDVHARFGSRLTTVGSDTLLEYPVKVEGQRALVALKLPGNDERWELSLDTDGPNPSGAYTQGDMSVADPSDIADKLNEMLRGTEPAGIFARPLPGAEVRVWLPLAQALRLAQLINPAMKPAKLMTTVMPSALVDTASGPLVISVVGLNTYSARTPRSEEREPAGQITSPDLSEVADWLASLYDEPLQAGIDQTPPDPYDMVAWHVRTILLQKVTDALQKKLSAATVDYDEDRGVAIVGQGWTATAQYTTDVGWTLEIDESEPSLSEGPAASAKSETEASFDEVVKWLTETVETLNQQNDVTIDAGRSL